MKIDSVGAVLTGHRILNPEMQRSWALVRIETDDGTIGWGEASTNWGHSLPDGVPRRDRGRLFPPSGGAGSSRHP